MKISHNTIQCLNCGVPHLNIKIPDILVGIVDLHFVVHWNKMVCRKRERLGLEHANYCTSICKKTKYRDNEVTTCWRTHKVE